MRRSNVLRAKCQVLRKLDEVLALRPAIVASTANTAKRH